MANKKDAIRYLYRLGDQLKSINDTLAQCLPIAMDAFPPSAVLRPELRVSAGGNSWLAIYDDLTGYGETPLEAMSDFDKRFYAQKAADIVVSGDNKPRSTEARRRHNP